MKMNLNFLHFKKHNKSIEPKKETRIKSKKGLIISSVVAGSAVAIGIALTVILIIPNIFPPIEFDYSKLNITELDDDYSGVYKKFKNSTGVDDYTKIYKPDEMVNIGLLNATNLESFKTITTGTVKASIATQVVRSTYIKENEKHFYENISSGLVKVGFRFYQKDEMVELISGKNITESSANWVEGKSTSLTTSEYDEQWGKDLSRRTIYIISSKTVLDTSTSEKTSDGYTVTIDLNPDLGSARYVKQIIMTSGLDRNPIFHSIKLTYHLDSNLMIQDVNMVSNYEVYKMIYVPSDEQLIEKYFYGDYQIPSLEEKCEY